MKLKSEKIKIDGTTYVVRELPVKVLLPLSQKMADGGVDSQMELLANAVEVDGELLGDRAGDLGGSVFMRIIKDVLRVNGMDIKEELGNAN